jgi:hypothetical protein
MSIWGPGYRSNRATVDSGPSPPWNASGLRITNVGEPEDKDDAVTKEYITAVGGASTTYVDAQDAKRVLRAGDTMTGDLLFTGATANRNLGCIDLGTGRAFTFYVGSLIMPSPLLTQAPLRLSRFIQRTAPGSTSTAHACAASATATPRRRLSSFWTPTSR